ncbi:hypothetical protein GCM10027160_23720 [Streptomyces calidiresistens]
MTLPTLPPDFTTPTGPDAWLDLVDTWRHLDFTTPDHRDDQDQEDTPR